MRTVKWQAYFFRANTRYLWKQPNDAPELNSIDF